MRIALHACCGPCLLEPFDALAAEHEVVVVYANPNIHPREEYELRRDTLLAHAAEQGIEVVEGDYDVAAWDAAVAGREHDPAARCRACFEQRLTRTAQWAAANGCEAIATTLTVSPYQDPVAIDEAGRAAAAAAGVEWLPTDFRDRYPEATRRSRSLGMYRQNYCGCRYSKVEAQADRERRRAARKAAKNADADGAS
jgi:predicted adenine nucleotide alpha hydrolase (AANH) superfamily ATPase